MREHEHVCLCGATITCDEPDCRTPREARCGPCVANPIRVTFVNPPIPLRDHDYSAVRDDYEPGRPIGHGATARAAIASLLIEEEERVA